MNKATAVKLPKFRARFDMLSSIFSEEEAKVATAFHKLGASLPIEKMPELFHVPMEKLAKTHSDVNYHLLK